MVRIYRDYEGAYYLHIAFSNQGDTGIRLVTYRSMRDGIVHTRPLSEFDEWVTCEYTQAVVQNGKEARLPEAGRGVVRRMEIVGQLDDVRFSI